MLDFFGRASSVKQLSGSQPGPSAGAGEGGQRPRGPPGIVVTTRKVVTKVKKATTGPAGPTYINALPPEKRRKLLEEEEERKKRMVEAEREKVLEMERQAETRKTKTKTGNDSPSSSKSRKREHVRSDGASTSSDADDDSASRSKRYGARRRMDKSSRSTSVDAYARFDVEDTVHGQDFVVERDVLAKEDGKVEAVSSEQIVRDNLKVYRPYFKGLDDPVPTVTLEYPGEGATESFALLAPKDRNEYDPVSELLRAISVIHAHYLTPEQQAMFGNADSLDLSTGTAATLAATISDVNGSSRAGSAPLPSAAATPLTTWSRDATPTAEGERSNAMSPTRLAPVDASPSRATPASGPEADSILRSLQKAKNRRDGPLFVRSVARFNEAFRALKDAGDIRENVRKMKGVREEVWKLVHDQSYSRIVGPKVEGLREYEAFSDNVYGELLPPFMSTIARLASLSPSSVFVDLGSGVSSLLLQAALQTGCSAYGVESMAAPSALADLQIAEARPRWRMWALNGGEVSSWRGDFLNDDRVRRKLAQADVVLVNNYAFTPRTNDALCLSFLDLKEGARVISLKPFVPPDFRLTERTLSSPLAILRVEERRYGSGSVSWTDGGGKYYIQTVDRSMIAAYMEKNGNGKAADGGGKASRKRNRRAIVDSDEEEG